MGGGFMRAFPQVPPIFPHPNRADARGRHGKTPVPAAGLSGVPIALLKEEPLCAKAVNEEPGHDDQ
jgi:hypothetical protein